MDNNIKLMQKTLQNNIIKSCISDLRYNNSITIDKTGKDLKVSIKNTLAAHKLKADQYKAMADQYAATIKAPPAAKYSGYLADEYAGKVIAPNMYSYEQCRAYAQANKPASEGPRVDNMCDMYNRCIRKYVQCQADCLVLETLINNLKDSKVYKLSVKEATALGL